MIMEQSADSGIATGVASKERCCQGTNISAETGPAALKNDRRVPLLAASLSNLVVATSQLLLTAPPARSGVRTMHSSIS